MPRKQIRPAWRPRDMAKHYGVPLDKDARGETLAIIDLGEVLDLPELKKDFAQLNVPFPDLKIVPVGNVDPTKLRKTPAIETHIDLEVLSSLAAGAKIHIYLCAQSFRAMAAGITQAVKDGVSVISISWGAAEDKLSSGDIYRIEQALKAAKDAGVSVVAASGDAGASGLTDPKTFRPINDPKKAVHCIYPGSSPHVLACGGTQLMQDGQRQFETAWNNTGDGPGRASGGGVSRQFDKPDWQAGIKIASANPGLGAGRILPDVAALAAVGDWGFFDQGGVSDPEGGTSAVAPFYAGILALANARRVAVGKNRLGFVNARLYDAASKAAIFEDITEGDNKVAPDGRGYTAQPGFDACTGWGVPKGQALIDALVDWD